MLVYEEVAAVIGEERAKVELGKVGKYVVTEPLTRSFFWDRAPQGNIFWNSINHGKSPYKDNDYNY